MKTVLEEAGGYMFYTRPDTLDHFVLRENFGSRQYLKHIELDKDDVWLDIGAHIGAFTVSIAERVKNVFAFEPFRANYALLTKNIAKNKLTNAEAYNIAVVGNGDNFRQLMSHHGKNTGNHSFLPIKGRTASAVSCLNIDNLIDSHGANSIKLDCEGAEYEIIMGIHDWSPIEEVVMEFHIEQLKDKHHLMFNEVIATMQNNGLRTSYVPVAGFKRAILHGAR